VSAGGAKRTQQKRIVLTGSELVFLVSANRSAVKHCRKSINFNESTR
jgi:hypothetical protein